MAKGDDLSSCYRPVLASFVRMQRDEVRKRWVLQAPERVLVLDEAGKTIIDRFDGKATLGSIIDTLVAEYDAPRDVLEHDVRAVVGLLSEKRFLRAGDDDAES